jgi:hypothetical protein
MHNKMENKRYKSLEQEYFLNEFETSHNASVLTISKRELTVSTNNNQPLNNFKDIKELVSNAEEIYSVALVNNKLLISKFLEDIDIVLEKIRYNSHFCYLLEYKLPPSFGLEAEENADSFICSQIVFEKFEHASFNNLCFNISSNILDHKIEVDHLYVIQLGKCLNPENSNLGNKPKYSGNDVSVMIPHIGEIYYLKTCLKYLKKQSVNVKDIHICFDDDSFLNLNMDFEPNQRIHLWKNSPQYVGPYYPRDFIFKIITSEYLIFQDSDDISTSDRIETLINEINKNHSCGMIGSHSLVVDEIENKIFIFRYPINVNNAFKLYPNAAVFHPTTIINKKAYNSTGGFTKWRKFASDAEFHLKASLFMQIQNSDNFLYIKRNRKESLITAHKTHIHSKIRKFFHQIWQRDFRLIQTGKLELRSSTLCEDELEPKIDFSLKKINRI